MASPIPESWKLLAWNGISLHVPRHWEVSSLATSYLQLDDGVGPVLELKWQRLKGAFSHQAQIKKLARLSKAMSVQSFRQQPTPERWRDALEDFEAQAFVWHGRKTGGEGTILYCASCRTATLLQFYRQASRDDPHIPAQVLGSLRDHSEDGWVAWSLFGLRALMPQRFTLSRHRFQPGHYQLAFQCQQERLSLERWGPADIQLKRGDLRQWFEQSCRDSCWQNFSSLEGYNDNGKPVLCGQQRGSKTIGARLWARLSGRLSHIWFRIWHLPAQNQILGVRAEGPRALDESLLGEICSNYEMVPETECAESSAHRWTKQSVRGAHVLPVKKP